MDASHSDADKMIANNTWDLTGLSMEDNHQQQQQINHHDSQLPFYHNSFYWPPQPPNNHFLNRTYHHHQHDYKPLPSLALTPTAMTTLDFINYDQYQQQQLQQQQEDDDDDDDEEEGDEGEKVEEEELGALKELMYNMAAMQPVDIDPATLHKPKRRNVRISYDPQSVAARHRRQRISEKIRILQRLVPGGTKMDTASMLDEAARYVKFLKRLIRRLQMNISAAAPAPVTHFEEPSGDWPLPTVIADTPSSSSTQQQQREGFGTTEEQQRQLRGCWRDY